eukprot:TRINITY_DN780_c0_g2_i2.p1 TRINITY_DN780_c0_g2~~TRINITY_DN780_c0_g2_i2.p1  ORF type:complete len:562 (-),score=104.40 TRINITY_DN780_c0_g2_i2:96-1781(-)
MKQIVLTIFITVAIVNGRSSIVERYLRGYQLKERQRNLETISKANYQNLRLLSSRLLSLTTLLNTVQTGSGNNTQNQINLTQISIPTTLSTQNLSINASNSSTSSKNTTTEGAIALPTTLAGSNCTASAECSNKGCFENSVCKCQLGYTGSKCEKALLDTITNNITKAVNETQVVKSNGGTTSESLPESIKQIFNGTKNESRPLASELKDLTEKLKSSAGQSSGSLDNLKEIASLGPKFMESSKPSSSGSGSNSDISLDESNQNDQKDKNTLRVSSLDQVKLIEQEIKKFSANQRGNLKSGGEMTLPDMNGIKGIVARLDFGECEKSNNTLTQSNQTTSQVTSQQLEFQVTGQNYSICGPTPADKPSIPNPPLDRIKSPTYKFSIQNPAIANLPASDLKNSSLIGSTANQQAFVNVPQSIGSRVSNNSQFSFTASANSFVANLNRSDIFGASPIYSVGFSDAKGIEIKIANLSEPVRLCVPTPEEIVKNSSVTPTCSYIDTNKPNDIDLSIEDDTNPPTGMTCCYLNHFSSFAVVGLSKSAAVLFTSIIGAILASFTILLS